MVEFSARCDVPSQLILNTTLWSVHFTGRETEAQGEDSHPAGSGRAGSGQADGLTFVPGPHCL